MQWAILFLTMLVPQVSGVVAIQYYSSFSPWPAYMWIAGVVYIISQCCSFLFMRLLRNVAPQTLPSIAGDKQEARMKIEFLPNLLISALVYGCVGGACIGSVYFMRVFNSAGQSFDWKETLIKYALFISWLVLLLLNIPQINTTQHNTLYTTSTPKLTFQFHWISVCPILLVSPRRAFGEQCRKELVRPW